MNPNLKEYGVFMDVARKYYSPKELIRLFDIMKDLGLNTFTLHFSEDIGLGLQCPAYDWLAGRDGILCTHREVGTVFPGTETLTVEDLEVLINAANERGIEIIPSFDSPGHLNYTVKKFHERVAEKGEVTFTFEGNSYACSLVDGIYRFFKNGIDLNYPAKTSGVYGIASFYTTGDLVSRVKGTNNNDYSRGIDLANEVAVAFVRSILQSFGQLFLDLGCTKIDLGADELLGFAPAAVPLDQLTRWQQLDSWKQKAQEITGLKTAVAYDLFVLYNNMLRKQMLDLGYTSIRIWNDEFRRTFDTDWNTDPTQHVQYDPDFIVEYWSSMPTYESPCSLADQGFKLISADATHSYYVLTDEARGENPTKYLEATPKVIAAEWTPYVFGTFQDGKPADGWGLDTQARQDQVIGAMFCIWSDLPIIRTDAEVVDELKPLLEAWSKKL